MRSWMDRVYDDIGECNDELDSLNATLNGYKLDNEKLKKVILNLGKEIEELRADLRVADEIAKARMDVLELIPECELHGNQCVPNAKTWVRQALWFQHRNEVLEVTNAKLRRQIMSGSDE